MATTVKVEFPVPEFDAPTVAFGARRAAYLTREQMGNEFWNGRNKFTDAAQSLFFNGGKLADHGLKFKKGIDPQKARNAIRALLCSFEPPHEQKIGTVGYALSQWCEPSK